jgi:hypothetical protein
MMNYYSIVLFVHIAGALGFFVALSVEWISVAQLRGATTAEQVRAWMRVATGVRRLGMASMLALLVSGFFMMAIAQIGGAWLIVAFWSLVVLAVLAVTLSFKRMGAITRAMSTEAGIVSASLRQLLRHPLLWIAIHIRVAIALGIVFLMTVKPDVGGSLLTIGGATVLGLALALPRAGRERAQDAPAA